jgi:ApaG protein
MRIMTSEPVNPRIRVEVETSYIEEQSDPRDKRFVFSYTITIRNEGQVPARLLTRHWIITDANGNVKETRGDGVVGEQPYLKPGQGFRYSSGAVIETPVGTMQGSYQMVADDGQQFDAPIAPFRLAMPGVLHYEPLWRCTQSATCKAAMMSSARCSSPYDFLRTAIGSGLSAIWSTADPILWESCVESALWAMRRP